MTKNLARDADTIAADLSDELVEGLPTRTPRDRREQISELASMLHVFEAAWRRGRALAIAERAIARDHAYGELHEAVLAAMRSHRDEHQLAAISFRIGCQLSDDGWPAAWLDVCDIGDVSEAIALEALGKVPDHFRRARRRRTANNVAALKAGDIRSLLRQPSAGDVLEQMIAGELVSEFV